MKINHFEDLDIWKDARSLCKIVFAMTSRKPFCNDYRFKDQIRAAAGSIMDNTAEGFGRGGNKEFIQFLAIAKGSCEETRSQAYRAFDFEYISKENLQDILDRTTSLSKRISGFIDYLKKSTYKGPKFKK